MGTRVISCTDLRIDNSVFIVPQGRYFMLPTKGVGYVALVDHLGMPRIVETNLTNYLDRYFYYYCCSGDERANPHRDAERAAPRV